MVEVVTETKVSAGVGAATTPRRSRPQTTLPLDGRFVDACDHTGQWGPARVVQVCRVTEEVESKGSASGRGVSQGVDVVLHYLFWDSKFDERIPLVRSGRREGVQEEGKRGGGEDGRAVDSPSSYNPAGPGQGAGSDYGELWKLGADREAAAKAAAAAFASAQKGRGSLDVDPAHSLASSSSSSSSSSSTEELLGSRVAALGSRSLLFFSHSPACHSPLIPPPIRGCEASDLPHWLQGLPAPFAQMEARSARAVLQKAVSSLNARVMDSRGVGRRFYNGNHRLCTAVRVGQRVAVLDTFATESKFAKGEIQYSGNVPPMPTWLEARVLKIRNRLSQVCLFVWFRLFACLLACLLVCLFVFRLSPPTLLKY